MHKGQNVILLLKVEKKIAVELQSHGLLATQEQPEPRVPEYADLAKLTYLACVIKESMRMHTVSLLAHPEYTCMRCVATPGGDTTGNASSCSKASCTQVSATDGMHLAQSVQSLEGCLSCCIGAFCRCLTQPTTLLKYNTCICA